ncbi:hypothetical protein BpHYR1_039402 [Brachionus plicatilis]|uniref:Uncharacterized protein n=1 Tax=Brachionus plicatilis TaxID=10195 RepID=A0A3M7SUC8_BRAPC|nr:hypothetical protein BpHYR1_039402 [Brachionus plicatilis]
MEIKILIVETNYIEKQTTIQTTFPSKKHTTTTVLSKKKQTNFFKNSQGLFNLFKDRKGLFVVLQKQGLGGLKLRISLFYLIKSGIEEENSFEQNLFLYFLIYADLRHIFSINA